MIVCSEKNLDFLNQEVTRDVVLCDGDICVQFASHRLCFYSVDAVHSYDLLLAWKSRWPDDGLSSLGSLGSKVISHTKHKLYTNITVDVGPEPLVRPDVSDQITHRSLFWSAVHYLF